MHTLWEISSPVRVVGLHMYPNTFYHHILARSHMWLRWIVAITGWCNSITGEIALFAMPCFIATFIANNHLKEILFVVTIACLHDRFLWWPSQALSAMTNSNDVESMIKVQKLPINYDEKNPFAMPHRYHTTICNADLCLSLTDCNKSTFTL